METVEYKNINFTVWDVGGQDKVGQRESFSLNASFSFSIDSDPTPMEALFPKHSRPDLCRR